MEDVEGAAAVEAAEEEEEDKKEILKVAIKNRKICQDVVVAVEDVAEVEVEEVAEAAGEEVETRAVKTCKSLKTLVEISKRKICRGVVDVAAIEVAVAEACKPLVVMLTPTKRVIKFLNSLH